MCYNLKRLIDINMKTVNKKILKDVANKLMFDMEDAQYDTLLEEFDVILKQMDIISEIPNIDDVEPMTFPFDVATTYLREDIAVKPLSQEEAFRHDAESGPAARRPYR